MVVCFRLFKFVPLLPEHHYLKWLTVDGTQYFDSVDIPLMEGGNTTKENQQSSVSALSGIFEGPVIIWIFTRLPHTSFFIIYLQKVNVVNSNLLHLISTIFPFHLKVNFF